MTKGKRKRTLLTALPALLLSFMLSVPAQTTSAQTGPFVSEIIVRTGANFKTIMRLSAS